jgi:hypothetical protein
MNYKYILIVVFVLVQLSVSYAGGENITEGPHTARQSLLLRLPEDLQKEMLTKWLDDDVKSRATLDTAHTNTVDRPELEKVCKENVPVSLLFDSGTPQKTSLDQMMNFIENKYKNINKLKIRFELLKRIPPALMSKVQSLETEVNCEMLMGSPFITLNAEIRNRIRSELTNLKSAKSLKKLTFSCNEPEKRRAGIAALVLFSMPQTVETVSFTGFDFTAAYGHVLKLLCSKEKIKKIDELSIQVNMLNKIDIKTISKIKKLEICLDEINVTYEMNGPDSQIGRTYRDEKNKRIKEESALLSSAVNLEEFILNCNGEVIGIWPILENISHTITKLSLTGHDDSIYSETYDHKIIKALCSHTQLEELHIASGFLYPQYSDEDSLEVALDNLRFLTREFSKLKKLRSLTIGSYSSELSEFTVNNGMFDFLRNNEVLEKLNLQSVFVSKNSLNSIVSCLNLKELTLSYLTDADLDNEDTGFDALGYDFVLPRQFIKILNGSQLSGDLKLTIHSASFFPGNSFDSLLLRFPNARVILGAHINY